MRKKIGAWIEPNPGFFLYFSSKDLQSVHWFMVGSVSCVPTVIQSNVQ